MRLFLILALLFASIEESHARRRRKSSSSSSRSSGKNGGWETAAGFFYANYTGNVKDFKESSGGSTDSYVVDIDIEYESGVGFSLETRSIENHSWGTIIGLEYNPSRKLEQQKYNSVPANPTLNGTTDKCNSDCPEIQTTNLILNTFYQWEQFYIPFGVFYSINNAKPESGFSTKMSNSLGFNLGFGFKIEDRYLLEINSRAFAFKVEDTDIDTGIKYTQEGIASIVSLALKVLF
jgi:hypothetical protein